MPSLKSRLLISIIRNRHLLKFRFSKEKWDENTSIPEFRRQCEAGARLSGKLPEEISISPVHIPGLPEGLAAEWAHPQNAAAEAPVVFYTHGGAYVSGSCDDHRPYIAKIAQWSGLSVLQYEYRLAPEHPFPAAVEDTLVVYRWLLEQGINPKRILIMGESAGGGLCLASLLAFRDNKLPLPAAAVALSPWTDLTLSSESYQSKKYACLSPIDMAKVCSRYYAGETDRTNPWLSPLFGDLAGLPPLLIMVGDDETMRDDSIRFAEKARQAGTQVTLRVAPGMVHCYPLMAPLFPEASAALKEVCAFLNQHGYKN
ncbi:MAG: alpha/beta hydrolase [Anaerolineae bacterium]|nr:alpha/beta hydrolase [Anaerolineae bacterium]